MFRNQVAASYKLGSSFKVYLSILYLLILAAFPACFPHSQVVADQDAARHLRVRPINTDPDSAAKVE